MFMRHDTDFEQGFRRSPNIHAHKWIIKGYPFWSMAYCTQNFYSQAAKSGLQTAQTFFNIYIQQKTKIKNFHSLTLSFYSTWVYKNRVNFTKNILDCKDNFSSVDEIVYSYLRDACSILNENNFFYHKNVSFDIFKVKYSYLWIISVTKCSIIVSQRLKLEINRRFQYW